MSGAEILWIAVDAARRGLGHGTRLLGRVLDHLGADRQVKSFGHGLARLDRDRQHAVLSELVSYQHEFEELIVLDGSGQERTRASRSGFDSSDYAVERFGHTRNIRKGFDTFTALVTVAVEVNIA